MLKKADWPDWLTVELLKDFIHWSKDHPSRERYVTNAPKFYQRFRGTNTLAGVSDIDDTELDARLARTRRNVIGETVLEVNSIFLKNKPVIRRWPFRAEHAMLSDDLDAVWLAAWDESHGQANLQAMLEDAEITGLGCAKVLWDTRAIHPDRPGRIVMEVIPGSALYVDPFASNSHRGQDVRWIIHHTRKLPEDLVSRYGHEAEVALGWRKATGKKSSIKGVLTMMNLSREAVTRNMMGKNVQSDLQSDDALRKDVYECWIFPQTMYDSELVSADKPPKEKFPHGLVATMIEDTIIRVMANPFVTSKQASVTEARGFQQTKRVQVGHKRHPFVFLFWRRIADSEGNRRFYDCMGMVEWMVSMQFNVDALRTNMAQNARTIGNPAVAYNEDALDMPPEDLILVPNQMVKVKGQYRLDEAVKILEPGAMPEQVYRMVMDDIAAIKETAGVKPGVLGLFPPQAGGTSHTPAATIGTLQESAFGPLWRYVFEVGDALVDFAKLYDGLIQQKYKPGHYMAFTKRGQQTMLEWTQEHSLAQFRYETVSGATTPLFDIEKQAREGEIMLMTKEALLSGDPRIMRITVIYLESLDYPWGYQYIEVLQQEAEAIQQQMQQQTELTEALGQGELMRQQQEGSGGAQEDGLALFAQQVGMSPDELQSMLSG